MLRQETMVYLFTKRSCLSLFSVNVQFQSRFKVMGLIQVKEIARNYFTYFVYVSNRTPAKK